MTTSQSVETRRYAPPRARVSDVTAFGSRADAEAIRREHIKHEASVRSIGALYFISGAVLLLVGVGAVLSVGLGRGAFGVLEVAALVIYTAFGVLSIVVGRGIRALQPWARTTCIVLSVIGLIGIPVGTLVSGYILCLLLTAKGKRLFEPDYPAIIAATPHIKYRTSVIVWIFVGLLILLILALVLATLGRSPAGA